MKYQRVFLSELSRNSQGDISLCYAAWPSNPGRKFLVWDFNRVRGLVLVERPAHPRGSGSSLDWFPVMDEYYGPKTDALPVMLYVLKNLPAEKGQPEARRTT